MLQRKQLRKLAVVCCLLIEVRHKSCLSLRLYDENEVKCVVSRCRSGADL